MGSGGAGRKFLSSAPFPLLLCLFCPMPKNEVTAKKY